MSPQIESMNWVPVLEAARRVRPDFWFELSTWDGRSDDDARDKDDFYAALGQQWTPRRYSGWSSTACGSCARGRCANSAA